MGSPFTESEREKLLQIARDALQERLGNRRPQQLDLEALPDRLRQDGASFVTLTQQGQLRGCIGSLTAYRPLVVDVQENAVAAAFRDPRFPPLTAPELEKIRVEVSVLSKPQPLEHAGPEDLLSRLRPNVDGVVLERGWNRATFLPQVWEQLPQTEEFLSHLCYKAGLPSNAWQWPDVEISTYQVEKFKEPER
ncbi:MAG: AmmeMemoRadiSam system protein A [Anaerolineales bacterium]